MQNALYPARPDSQATTGEPTELIGEPIGQPLSGRDAVLSTGDAREIARFFQVLADPTRVRPVKALADGEWCVSDLTQALEMDQPAVSHQLKYLRELGLVKWIKIGRHVYYSLSDSHLREILISSIAHLECG